MTPQVMTPQTFSIQPPSTTKKISADYHTNAAAFREFLTMFLGSFYLWGSLFEEMSSDKSKTPLGYSQFGTIMGMGLATIIATGSTYIHWELDKLHQEDMDAARIRSTDSKVSQSKLSYSFRVPEANETISSYKNTALKWLTNSGKITLKQSFMIAVAMLGGAGDFVGFLEDITDIEFTSLTTKPELIAMNFALLLVGLVAAWAEARACKIAMEHHNETAVKAQTHPNQSADFFTHFSLVVKTFQTSAANLLFYATILDKINGADADTDFEVSKQGLLYALPLSAFVTFATVYYQYYINVSHQGHYKPSQELTRMGTNTDEELNISEESSTSGLEKLLLFGRALGTGTDFAEDILFLLRNILSAPLYFAMACLSLAVGLATSVSDVRNGIKSSQEYQKNKKPASPGSCWATVACCLKDEDAKTDDKKRPLLKF